ncbi:MAG: hypothetical protein C0497_14890 [Gemmatimonas sp.]|nr:hypothetical protein [Gemmatimonas sp.]
MATKLKRKNECAGGTATGNEKATERRAKQEATERAAAVKANRQKSLLIAAAAVFEAELDKLAATPSKDMLLRARAMLDDEADPAMPLEQLVVRLAVAFKFRDLAWSLTSSHNAKRTLQELRDWGLDPIKTVAAVQVETCVHCGCSEFNACRLGQHSMGPSCHWVSESPRVCSNPECVALWKGQASPPVVGAEEEDDDDA